MAGRAIRLASGSAVGFQRSGSAVGFQRSGSAVGPEVAAVRVETIRAGTPTAMAPGGTLSRTTAPAPTMAWAPTVTPSRILAPAPVHAPSPMVTPEEVRPCARTGTEG